MFAVCRIPVPEGIVNSMEFTDEGNTLIVGMARTHKLGSWIVRKVPNCVLRISLNFEARNGLTNGHQVNGKEEVRHSFSL